MSLVVTPTTTVARALLPPIAAFRANWLESDGEEVRLFPGEISPVWTRSV